MVAVLITDLYLELRVDRMGQASRHLGVRIASEIARV
jgi:hypothetical protein